MSDHNGGNGGNGDKPSRHSSLDVVEEQIAARQAEEAQEASLGTLDVEASAPFPDVEEAPPSSTEDDPVNAWKRRVPGKPVTLEQIHAGLIATCTYSEAAIEATVKMAQDVNEVVRTVDDRTQQIAILTAKAESTNAFVHKVDAEMAEGNKLLSGLRKDVQFMKDDLRELKGVTQQLAAIKGMLVEIIARLPSPEESEKSKPDPV